MFSKHIVKLKLAVAGMRLNIHKRKFSSSTSRYVHFLFKKNLFLTNTLTSGGFMALGDMLQQEYEFHSKKIPERYDWERIKRMFYIGTFLGSLHHYYYLYLDILLPKRCIKTVLQKVAADQFFCAPLTIVLFFYGLGYMESKSFTSSTNELKNKFKYVYLGDCIFWPPVQCVNFYYLPSQYRVFYINIATLVFDVFLSMVKHFDHDQK